MGGVIGSGLEGYLHRQARERALNRLAEAQEQADTLLKQAAEEIDTEKGVTQQQLAYTLSEQRKQARAQARLKALQTRANRYEELVGRLWEEVEDRLQQLAQQEITVRRALLERLLTDAAAQLGSGSLEIQTNAHDASLLNDETLTQWAQHLRDTQGVAGLVRQSEPADIMGGLIVYRVDTNELVDNSLDERLALAKRILRDDVFRVLESGAHADTTANVEGSG